MIHCLTTPYSSKYYLRKLVIIQHILDPCSLYACLDLKRPELALYCLHTNGLDLNLRATYHIMAITIRLCCLTQFYLYFIFPRSGVGALFREIYGRVRTIWRICQNSGVSQTNRESWQVCIEKSLYSSELSVFFLCMLLYHHEKF